MKLFKWFIIGIFLFTPVFAYSAPSLAARLKGRILLAVEDKGKTYYVFDGYRYLITRATAQTIFKKLALGISNKNLEQIPIKEIVVEPEVLPEPVERIVYVDRYIEKQCPSVESYKNEIDDLNRQIETLKSNWDIKGQQTVPTISPPSTSAKDLLKKTYSLRINEFQKQLLNARYRLEDVEEVITVAEGPNWRNQNPQLKIDSYKRSINNEIETLTRNIALSQNELEKKLLELE